MNDEDPLIILLYNVEESIACGEPQDLVALQDRASVANQILSALNSYGYHAVPITVRGSLEELEESLRPFPPQTAFVFNICDSFAGSNRDAVKVVRLLEKLNYRHTGSSSTTVSLCIDKSRTKTRLLANGIPTPFYQVYTQPSGFYEHIFPSIIKPARDDGSVGINSNAVVTNQEQLVNQVAYIIEQYRQPALVEAFIPGRELSISMMGNKHIEVLPISEMDYSEITDSLKHFLSFESKWVPESFDFQHIPTRCPANIHGEDKFRVMDAAIRAFRAVGLRDFGRVDIRYHDGIPYVIDINEIPDLAPESGFPTAALKAGYDYAGMIDRLLRIAMKRENWQCRQLALKSVSPQMQTV